MLLLRQLATTGLIMLLLPLWQTHPLTSALSATDAASGGGEQAPAAVLPSVDPAAVQAAAAALRQVVLAEPAGFAAALFTQLAHGHPLLDGEAQQRTAR